MRIIIVVMLGLLIEKSAHAGFKVDSVSGTMELLNCQVLGSLELGYSTMKKMADSPSTPELRDEYAQMASEFLEDYKLDAHTMSAVAKFRFDEEGVVKEYFSSNAMDNGAQLAKVINRPYVDGKVTFNQSDILQVTFAVAALCPYLGEPSGHFYSQDQLIEAVSKVFEEMIQ